MHLSTRKSPAVPPHRPRVTSIDGILPAPKLELTPAVTSRRFPPWFRRAVLLVLALMVCSVLVYGVLHLVRRPGVRRPSVPRLPARIVSEVSGFNVFSIKPGFATDFRLRPSSVSYRQGVLEFVMVNSVGKTLVFTEEALPSGFSPASIRASNQLNTEYGKVFITSDTTRTTGSLISANGTWVIINAPNPIGSSLMEQIVQALAPVAKS